MALHSDGGLNMTTAAQAALGGEPAAKSREAILAGVIGNALEWYDFAVYGYFARTIGNLYFPSDDPKASLLAAFGVFAAGFLMRPLGAVHSNTPPSWLPPPSYVCFAYQHQASFHFRFSHRFPPIKIAFGPSCDHVRHIDCIAFATKKVIGVSERDEALRMLCGRKNVRSIFDSNQVVDWRMKH